LVTGGTRGFGRAIAKEFARTGATVFVTHRWGSVDAAEIDADFERSGLTPPHMVESDASDPQATQALMQKIRSMDLPLHAVVSNAAFGKVARSFDDLTRTSLERSIAYSAWPLVDLVRAARATFPRVPRYFIAVSTDRHCHDGYDLLGASKSVLETLCRYLAFRLKGEGVRVNAVVPGAIDSVNLEATIGSEVAASLRARGDVMLDPARMARACVALASGLLDAMTGQVLVVDEGWSLVSPIAMLTANVGPFGFPDEREDTS